MCGRGRSPSLEAYPATVLNTRHGAYLRGRAKAVAAAEIGDLPETCPWSIEQLLDDEYWSLPEQRGRAPIQGGAAPSALPAAPVAQFAETARAGRCKHAIRPFQISGWSQAYRHTTGEPP
jgi:hypothetical protein